MGNASRDAWALIRSRTVVIAAALAVALSIGFAVVVQAADQRLTQADAALQTAEGLVQAAEAPHLTGPRAARFERHKDRAVLLMERARDQIQAAKDVSDAGNP